MLGRRCSLVVANTKLPNTWHSWTGPCSQPQHPEEGSELGCGAGGTEQSAQPAKDTSLGQTTHSTATRPFLWSPPKLEEEQLHTAAEGKGKHPHWKKPSCRDHSPAAFQHWASLFTMLRRSNRELSPSILTVWYTKINLLLFWGILEDYGTFIPAFKGWTSISKAPVLKMHFSNWHYGSYSHYHCWVRAQICHCWKVNCIFFRLGHFW